MEKTITISGVGCALIDNIYNNVSFDSPLFKKYMSINAGDGGLSPGKLVFAEEFEQYAQTPFQQALSEITRNKPADIQNIGGPCLVALINAAQLTSGENIIVKFFGARGDDENGRKLSEMVSSLPVNLTNYKALNQTTPFTDVFSDPDYNDGEGERIFVNNIGAAWKVKPDDLDEDFFNADIHVYGGTALVPLIHDNLEHLLAKSKKTGAFTVVNTVYDFRNEKNDPDVRWPMGSSDKAYGLIDCLITDHEEAIRLSGKSTQKEAMEFFLKNGVGSCIITNGANPLTLAAVKEPFVRQEMVEIPVSAKIKNALISEKPTGDTTGCGDNFVGGVLAAVAHQRMNEAQVDLMDAAAWGVASGGYACFYMGGTFTENYKGEKKEKILPYVKAYQNQMNR